MKIESGKKVAASLLCALLLWTSEAQATQQIGKIFSNKPGETIPAASTRGMDSLGSPDAAPAAISPSASPASNPANLAPAPGLAPESAPTARPGPEATATSTPAAADSGTPAEQNLTSELQGNSEVPTRIEAHAVAAAQPTAADLRPKRRLQFSVASLLKATTMTAMLLGFRQGYLRDTEQLREPTRWQREIQPMLNHMTTIPHWSEHQNKIGGAQYTLGDEFSAFMDSIEGNGSLSQAIDFLTNSNRNNQIWMRFASSTAIPYYLIANDRGTKPKPRSEAELLKLWVKFRTKDGNFPGMSYEYFQYLGAADALYLEALNDPKLLDTPEHAQQFYLRFLREVLPKHPRFDEQTRKSMEEQARTIFDAVNSLDGKTRWFRLKHRLQATLIIAVTTLMYGFGQLKRKAKSSLSWLKQAASRSKGTPLMGAVLFALPGSGALLGAVDPWGILGMIEMGVPLAAMGYLACRYGAFRGIRFSLLGLFKTITAIAILCGFFRMIDQDQVHLEEMQDAQQPLLMDLDSLASLKDLKIGPKVPPEHKFVCFLQEIRQIHDDIHHTRNGKPFNLLYAFGGNHLTAYDLIGARQTPWTGSGLRALYPEYLRELERRYRIYKEQIKKGKDIGRDTYNPIPSYEEFELIADVHALYLRAQNDPRLWEDPEALYQAFLDRVAKYEHLADVNLKELDQRTRAAIEDLSTLRKQEKIATVKHWSLGGLGAAFIAGMFWPKRRRKP